jgi:hypothetical protein
MATTFPPSVIKLAHDKADAICMKTARATHAARLKSFLEIPIPEITRRLRTTLEKQLHYLENQDTGAWREFATAIVEDRIRRGMNPWDVIRAGQIMLDILTAFFEKELAHQRTIDGQETSKIVARLKARIQGMNAVATAVATNIGLKHGK